MLSIVAIWTVSYFFANLFTCYPVTPLVESFYGNKCINTIPMWLSVVATDLIVDVAILLMPVPLVLQLHLPLKDKLGVLAMFMLGARYLKHAHPYCGIHSYDAISNQYSSQCLRHQHHPPCYIGADCR